MPITGGQRPNSNSMPHAALFACPRILRKSGALRLFGCAAGLCGELCSLRIEGRQNGYDDLAFALALGVRPVPPVFEPPAPYGNL